MEEGSRAAAPFVVVPRARRRLRGRRHQKRIRLQGRRLKPNGFRRKREGRARPFETPSRAPLGTRRRCTAVENARRRPTKASPLSLSSPSSSSAPEAAARADERIDRLGIHSSSSSSPSSSSSSSSSTSASESEGSSGSGCPIPVLAGTAADADVAAPVPHAPPPHAPPPPFATAATSMRR